jgi:GNAT superfamily N-acetyltransferase
VPSASEHAGPVRIRVAAPGEHARARAAYEAWGYDGGVRPADTVFLAESSDGGELLGVVRLTLEEGTRMLRGMQVAPAAQRRGIGTRLLHALVERLGDEPCYCVPYAHLVAFYGQAGFAEYPLGRAPAFLVERIGTYRCEGLAVTLMRWPGAGAGDST